MPIQLVHVSDIHLGSGESHGRLNQKTGLNVRFEDLSAALERTVTYSIEKKVDIYLFAGDAYKNATPEPIYQKAFAEQLKRLSNAGIQTILLVGNHDQILKSTGSHSMSVFQSLEVPNLITIDQPKVVRVDTAHGALQIVGLPHVTRHLLMTHERYADMSGVSLDKMLVSMVTDVLNDLYAELDPNLPTVSTAHIMVDRARAGCEQELMIGYSLTFPLDIFIDKRVDYVALGHVHRHQVLREANPTIVYCGSLERIDFGETDEEKGFIHAQLERGKTTFQFISSQPRPFVDIKVDLIAAKDPTAKLIQAIKKKVIPGCVLRVTYKIDQQQAAHVDEQAVRLSAESALSLRLRPEIMVPQRTFRMPNIDEVAVTSPLAALEIYLQKMAPERKEELLRRARELAEKIDQ